MWNRFFVLVALCSFIDLLAFSQPKIALNAERIDLGVMYNGASKASEIRITNAGTDTLRILSIQTSCGCTTVKQPKSTLLPREFDILKVEFNSTGFRGPSTKYVNITTNDPAKPYASVALTADVRDELQATNIPGMVWFGNVRVGTEAGLTVSFKNLSRNPITVKGIASSHPAITAALQQRSAKPNEEIRIEFKVNPKQEGYVNELTFIETDSKNQPRVPVRVSFLGVKPS